MNKCETEGNEDMEIPKKEDGLGGIKIADDVVVMIAAMAAADVEGVAGAAGGIASDIANMFTKSKQTKGKSVRVEVNEEEGRVDVYLAVEYGHSLVVVAEKVQEAVKSALEVMTGLQVEEVNVHVQAVDFKQPENKEV
jgi:uncharacterized alkaline shock family protein YloU